MTYIQSEKLTRRRLEWHFDVECCFEQQAFVEKTIEIFEGLAIDDNALISWDLDKGAIEISPIKPEEPVVFDPELQIEFAISYVEQHVSYIRDSVFEELDRRGADDDQSRYEAWNE